MLQCFGHEARGILAPPAGIKPAHPTVEALSPNHWTAREGPPNPFSLFPALQGLERRAAIQMLTLTAPAYLTKTLNRISLLWGLRLLSCQTWVFQASTFRKEDSYVGKTAPGLAPAWRDRGPFMPLVSWGGGETSRPCPHPLTESHTGKGCICLSPSDLKLLSGTDQVIFIQLSPWKEGPHVSFLLMSYHWKPI